MKMADKILSKTRSPKLRNKEIFSYILKEANKQNLRKLEIINTLIYLSYLKKELPSHSAKIDHLTKILFAKLKKTNKETK